MAKPWLEEDGLTKIEGWARAGLSEKQIAKNMGIAYSTFRNWKNDYVALSASLKKGKEVVDFEVENALYKKAMGFEYEETETYIEIVDGERKQRVKKFTRRSLPDTQAMIYWLNNRKPNEWRKLAPEVSKKIKAETRKLEAETEEFIQLSKDNNERLLKLEQMAMNITKSAKEIEFIEERTKLMKGAKKDTSLLEALIEVVDDDE